MKTCFVQKKRFPQHRDVISSGSSSNRASDLPLSRNRSDDQDPSLAGSTVRPNQSVSVVGGGGGSCQNETQMSPRQQLMRAQQNNGKNKGRHHYHFDMHRRRNPNRAFSPNQQYRRYTPNRALPMSQLILPPIPGQAHLLDHLDPPIDSTQPEVITSVRSKVKRSYRHIFTVFGGGFFALLALPFGPIGLFVAGLAGALLGTVIGAGVDACRNRRAMKETHQELYRLQELLRLAEDRFNLTDDSMMIVERVVTEFYPVAEVAQYSTTAQQQLKMLYKFVSKQCVQEVLEVFMDDFFEHWRFLPRQDLVRICTYIFKTLVCTYEWCSKKPSRTVTRMEQFLSNSHIESLCSKGLGGLTKKDPRLSFDNEASRMQKTMELMVYRDIHPTTRPSSLNLEDEDTPTVDGSRQGSSSIQVDFEASKDPLTSPKNKIETPWKSFSDYINFPKELKHSMGIHSCEFDFLMEKHDEGDDKFETVQDKPKMKLQKYKDLVGTEGGFLTLVRAYVILEDLSMESIIYNILDIGQRNRVEAPAGGCELMTSTFKSPAPWIVQHRDFVQYRRVTMRQDQNGDPIYMILFRSAEHPDVPERKGVVRGETYMSGYIVKKKEGTENQLDFFLVALADPRGFIPKWVVNKGSTTAPPQWMASLRAACLDVMHDEAQVAYANEYVRQMVTRVNDNTSSLKGSPNTYSSEGMKRTPSRSLVLAAAHKSKSGEQNGQYSPRKNDSFTSLRSGSGNK